MNTIQGILSELDGVNVKALGYIDDVEELIQHIKDAKLDFNKYYQENQNKNALGNELAGLVDAIIEKYEELKKKHQSGAESLEE